MTPAFACERQSRPISRILCMRAALRLRTRGSHSSRRAIADALELPTRRRDGGPALHPKMRACLFGIAPGGGYRAVYVAADAVRSYRTVSPLPDPGFRRAIGGLLSVALFRVSPRMAVSHHPARWSPDFPRPSRREPGKPRLPGLLCNLRVYHCASSARARRPTSIRRGAGAAHAPPSSRAKDLAIVLEGRIRIGGPETRHA